MGLSAVARGLAKRLVLGNLTIDRTAYQVRVGDSDVDLTFLEYELLLHLVRNVGRVLSRDELLRRFSPDTSLDRSRTVDVQISRLRKKLTGSYPWVIRTVKKRGYAMFDQSQVRVSPTGRAMVASA